MVILHTNLRTALVVFTLLVSEVAQRYRLILVSNTHDYFNDLRGAVGVCVCVCAVNNFEPNDR